MSVPNQPPRPATEEGLLAAGGFKQVTALSTAKGIGTPPAGAYVALVQCESQAVRWRDDGVAPTTTVGFLMRPGDAILFDQRLDLLQFIETQPSAMLNIAFYKGA